MDSVSSVDHVQPSRVDRLLIIDGNAILHRAYHALPPLTAPDGIVVNAVYGFTSMLLKLVTDLHPVAITVAFDRPKPTFRKELLESYQAQRPKMDDELVAQVSIVHDVITSFHIPIFEVDGFEADDVIGTIVNKLSVVSYQLSAITDNPQPTTDNHIDQVIIVTGDRDILQLVEDEKVLVYMPVKGLSEAKLYGEKEVKERLGVDPLHIPDFKGLAGDASDNYPGVAGIGPKTAVSLLEQFGTVEGVYTAVEQGKTDGLSEKIIEKLTSGKESAMLSKNLATIRTDVPIDIDWSVFHLNDLNTEESRQTLLKLGFSSLVKRLTGESIEKEKKEKASGKGKKKELDSKGEQLTLV